MGLTNIQITITSLDDKRKSVTDEFLVDTGASYTVVPDAIAKKLELKPIKEQKFSLADGSIVRRNMGHALVSLNGDSAPTRVVIGKRGDSAILGTITLEEMGFIIDPFKRELRPMKLMLA